MVFKVVAGSSGRIAAWWTQPNPSSEFNTAALNTNNTFKGFYKNRIVTADKWKTFKHKEVSIFDVL